MNYFTIAITWLKDLIVLPTNFAKIANINTNLKLQNKLSETQQRLEKAENRLAKYAAIESGRMFFCNNVFWAKDADGQIEKSPYCPRCFELDGKVIHLVTWYKNAIGTKEGKCPECKVDKFLFKEPE